MNQRTKRTSMLCLVNNKIKEARGVPYCSESSISILVEIPDEADFNRAVDGMRDSMIVAWNTCLSDLNCV